MGEAVITGNMGGRVVIENVAPEIEGGLFPIKRVVGEKVPVTADIFADGHDSLSARILYRTDGHPDWKEAPLSFLENDRWGGEFVVDEMGVYYYMIEGWIDGFKTWQRDMKKRFDAGAPLSVDVRAGLRLIEESSERALAEDRTRLLGLAGALEQEGKAAGIVSIALNAELSGLMARHPPKDRAVTHSKELSVVVDRKKALFSAWYELFPRSCSPEPDRRGTFKDCEAWLPELGRMGFDVLYLPPIHPIGATNRKGKDNANVAEQNDVGSPWAIGGKEGGHKSVHRELGSLEDFERLIERAAEHGMEIAMDLAFQCSPDHPYVKEHPDWFKWRPDGTIQCAENPPKIYEDIVPLNFETEDREALWEELKSIVLFWIGRGIRIFRADNPHTKPFAFWEWLIQEVKRGYPEVIFFAEAFTRPKIMYRLAKCGFTQSYTYFTWRNTKTELIDYLTALTQTEIKEYFRPNLWPNTPDINPEFLQYGGRPAFTIRLVLAATLASNYGIYGPPFDLFTSEPLPGKEEYAKSEKYEVRHWDLGSDVNLRDFIARINRIRNNNPALQATGNLTFHETSSDYLLFYVKATDDPPNIILVIVNLDPFHTQSGWIRVPLRELEIDPAQPYLVHDLLSDDKYIWQGERNYVELDPQVLPANILEVKRRVRRETDFDYFM